MKFSHFFKFFFTVLLCLCFVLVSHADDEDGDENGKNKPPPRIRLQNLRRELPIIPLSLSEHERLNSYIADMVLELYPELAPRLEIHVHVLDEVYPSASIFTGDLRKTVNEKEVREIHIFLSKGLLCDLSDQEKPTLQATHEELRFIMGHEMGHLDSCYKDDWVTGQLQEVEADNRATFASVRAGFDPEAGIDFFRKLLKLESPQDVMVAAVTGHPPTAERIYAMQGYLAQLRKAQGEQFNGEKRETPLPEWMVEFKYRKFVHPYMQDMQADGYDQNDPEKALQIFKKHYYCKKQSGLLEDKIIRRFYTKTYLEFITYLSDHADNLSQKFIDDLFEFGTVEIANWRASEFFSKFKTLPSPVRQALDSILILNAVHADREQQTTGLKAFFGNKHWYSCFAVFVKLQEFQPVFDNLDAFLMRLHELQSDASLDTQCHYYIRMLAINLISEAGERGISECFKNALEKLPLFLSVESYEEYNDMTLRVEKWTLEGFYRMAFSHRQMLMLALLHKPIADFVNKELTRGGTAREKAIQFMEERIFALMSGKYKTRTTSCFSQSEDRVSGQEIIQNFDRAQLLSYPIVGEPILLENPTLVFRANLEFDVDLSKSGQRRWTEVHPTMTVAAYSVLTRFDELGRVDLIEKVLSDLEAFQPRPSKNVMDLVWGGEFVLGERSEAGVLRSAALIFFKQTRNLTSEQKIRFLELFFPTASVDKYFFDMYMDAAELQRWTVRDLYQEIKRVFMASREFVGHVLERQNRPVYSHLVWMEGALANELAHRFQKDPSCLEPEQICFILRSTRFDVFVDETPFIEFFSRASTFPVEFIPRMKLWIILSERHIVTRQVKDQVLDEMIAEVEELKLSHPLKALKCGLSLLKTREIDRDSKREVIGKIIVDAWIAIYGVDDHSQEYFNRASRFLGMLSRRFLRGADSRYETFCYFANQSVSQRELSYKTKSYIDASHYFKRESSQEIGIEVRVVSLLYGVIKKADETDRKDFLLWLIDQKPLTRRLAREIKGNMARMKSRDVFSFKEHMTILKEFFWSRRLEQRAVLTAVAIEPNAEKIPSSHPTFQWVLDLAFEGSADQDVTRVVKSLLTVYYEALPDFEKNFFLGGLLTASRNKSGGVGEALSSFFGAMGPAGAKLAQAAHTMLVGVIAEEDRAKLARHKNLSSPPERWEIFEMVDKILPESVRERIAHFDVLLGSASIKIVVQIETQSGELYALNIVRPHTARRAESEFYILETAARDMVAREGSSYQIIVDMIVRARQKIEQEVQQDLERDNLKLAEKAYQGRGFKYITIETIPLGPADMQGELFTVTKLIQGKTIEEIADRRLRSDVARGIVETELDLILGGRSPIDLDRHFGNFLFIEETQTIVHLDFGQLRKNIPALTITRFIDLNRALAEESSYNAARILKLFDPSSSVSVGHVQVKIEEHIENNGGWDGLSLTQRLIYTLSAMRSANLTAPEDLLDLNTALGKLAEYQVYFDDPGDFARLLERKGFYYRVRNAPRAFVQSMRDRVYTLFGYSPSSDDVPPSDPQQDKLDVVELFPRSEDGTLQLDSENTKEHMLRQMARGLRQATASEGLDRMMGEARAEDGTQDRRREGEHTRRWLHSPHR